VIVPDGRWLFALDDTPTKRYGRRVEGAGIHHNPTPGPAVDRRHPRPVPLNRGVLRGAAARGDFRAVVEMLTFSLRDTCPACGACLDRLDNCSWAGPG
jgi:hypothetical protein